MTLKILAGRLLYHYCIEDLSPTRSVCMYDYGGRAQMRKVIFITMLVGILAFGFAGTAKADSFPFTVTGNDGSSTLFTATVTSTDVTIVVSCLNVTCEGNFLSTVGLKGISFTAVTDIPAGDPTGFSAVQNGGTNNGQTGDCDGTQLFGSVCWTTTIPLGGGTPLQIGS